MEVPSCFWHVSMRRGVCCLDPVAEKRRHAVYMESALGTDQVQTIIQLQGGESRRAWPNLSAREIPFIYSEEGKVAGRRGTCGFRGRPHIHVAGRCRDPGKIFTEQKETN